MMLTKSPRRGRRGEVVAFLNPVVLAFLLFCVLVGKFHTSSVTVTATSLSTDEGSSSPGSGKPLLSSKGAAKKLFGSVSTSGALHRKTKPVMPNNCGVPPLGLSAFPEVYVIPLVKWVKKSMLQGKKNFELAKLAALRNYYDFSCSPSILYEELLYEWRLWAERFSVKLKEGSRPDRGIKMFFKEASEYALSGSIPEDLCKRWESKEVPPEIQDQPCNEDPRDPVWRLLKDVKMCGKPKTIVCKMLQSSIESFRASVSTIYNPQ